ncbi:MAG TPA: ketoacyl-ACP synthase III, partial [Anaerolineae bacterium]|nr:ketoacyl-ACP synthase III [Anaerolineae bacterium]
MPFAHITGWGMYVPEPVLTNDDIAKLVETSDEWIRSRTGIRERHIARENEFPSTLGVEASLKALQVANLAPTELDLIICTSSSPEYIFPATACLIQDQIGATKAGAFDLLAACSGFIYAVNMAAQAIRSGSIKNALVVGTETLSRFINWKDRNTCILFGDGAGAFVLQASDKPGGVLSAVMHSDGSGADLLTLPGGGARHPATETTVHDGKHYVYMDGKEVFRFATRVMGQATQESLQLAGLTTADLQWIIPHQANYRIIETAAKYLKMPMEKFVVNVDRFGNTSTASIPIATVEAVEKGQVKSGDKIVFVG